MRSAAVVVAVFATLLALEREAGLNTGFPQMLDPLQFGRVNVAARGMGLTQRAGARTEVLAGTPNEVELRTEVLAGTPNVRQTIAQHQAIQFKLTGMAIQVEAAAPAHPPRGPDEGRRRELGDQGRDGQAIRRGDRPLLRRGMPAQPRRSTRSSACTARRRCC
jgi:alkylation response protein AidB-like acyl-CoA dehydrogenase